MKPPRFEYRCPSTLNEALQILQASNGDAKIIAGGQSLVPMMNLRMLHPSILIDINRLVELNGIRVDGGYLSIGSLTRHQALHDSPVVAKACPLMSEAYGYVAHLPIRNRGTLGGNLCHSDPSSEMPAVLLACDAVVTIVSHEGSRQVSIDEFLLGPLQTVVEPHEIVTEIRVPISTQGEGASFREVSARKGDFAMAAIGTVLKVTNNHVTRAAIVAAGMGDRALRLKDVEEFLLGKEINNSVINRASEMAAQIVKPDSSHQASEEFKKSLVQTLVARTIADAFHRANA